MEDKFFLLISTALLEGSALLIDLSVQLSWVSAGNRGDCVATALKFSG